MRLALPAIVSNITTPLLGLVDTAIVGHMGAPAYIGAIAVGGSMFSLAYWLLAFLRMGTSGLTAQAYGAAQDTHSLLWRSLLVAAIAAVLIIAFSPLIAAVLLMFMDAEPLTSELARKYFLIVVFGAPAVLGTYSLSGWLLGRQDSRTPMWMALATNVSNIAISVSLVYGAGLKIEGVALGTLVSQWIGLLLGLWISGTKHEARLSSWPGWKSVVNGKALSRFFSVNAYIFLRTLCLVAVTLWFTRTGSHSGTSILAANALLMQLFILFSYFMDGFAYAGEALAGKYWGMSNFAALRATVHGLFVWGFSIGLLFTAFYAFGGKPILLLLSDEASVVSVAMSYLPWAIAVPLAGTAAFIWDGVFIGLTMNRQMLISMFVATVVYFIIYFTLSPTMANHGLWLAFISYLFLRGLVQTICWLMQKKRPCPEDTTS